MANLRSDIDYNEKAAYGQSHVYDSRGCAATDDNNASEQRHIVQTIILENSTLRLPPGFCLPKRHCRWSVLNLVFRLRST